MSATITYPFTTDTNYTFDSDKIEVVGGKAKLKLADNTGQTFNEDFASDSGFTYDSDDAEFTSGLVRQKDQRPANANCWATFKNNINMNYSVGTPAGTAYNGATITDNKLDLSGGVSGRYLSYNANNAPNMGQTGSIKMKIRPSYTGNPSKRQDFVTIGTSSTSNYVGIYHYTNGYIRGIIHDNTGAVIGEAIHYWNPGPTENQEYEVMFCWDVTAGNLYFFIDGTLVKSETGKIGTRSATMSYCYLGRNYGGTHAPDFYVNDLVFYTDVQKTANYTPGYTLEETRYVETEVELPQFSYSGLGALQAFTGFSTTDANTPRYTVNGEYWNGSAWVSSDGSWAEASPESDVLAQIASVTASDTLDISVVFQAGSTQMSCDDLTMTYTGQAYPTDDPTIVVNSTFTSNELASFTETATKTGSDEIKYCIRKNSVDYYITGGSAAVSNGTYAQSNTATEVNTDIDEYLSARSTVGLKCFLHSDDGSTTPELDLIVISYNATLPTATVPVEIDLEGFIYDATGPESGVAIKIRPYQAGFVDAGVFVHYEYQTIATTDADGWFESFVYVNPSSDLLYDIKIGKQAYTIDLSSKTGLVDISTLTLTVIED